jgi:hypothetical protein
MTRFGSPWAYNGHAARIGITVIIIFPNVGSIGQPGALVEKHACPAMPAGDTAAGDVLYMMILSE